MFKQEWYRFDYPNSPKCGKVNLRGIMLFLKLIDRDKVEPANKAELSNTIAQRANTKGLIVRALSPYVGGNLQARRGKERIAASVGGPDSGWPLY